MSKIASKVISILVSAAITSSMTAMVYFNNTEYINFVFTFYTLLIFLGLLVSVMTFGLSCFADHAKFKPADLVKYVDATKKKPLYKDVISWSLLALNSTLLLLLGFSWVVIFYVFTALIVIGVKAGARESFAESLLNKEQK